MADLRASYGAGEAHLRRPRLSADESLLGVAAPQEAASGGQRQTSSRYQYIEVARREAWSLS
jgi:hypothetical protein